ncbi:hypothetical protein [Methylocystis sp. S23]
MKIREIVRLGAVVGMACFCLPALAQDAATIPAPDGLPAWLAPLWPALVPLAVSGLSSFISAILPQGQPGTVWGAVRALIDALAMNWLNAKNVKK